MTAALLLVVALQGDLPVLTPERAGTRITQSVRIAPGTWRVPDPEGIGVLVVAADGVVIDFAGAELVGSSGGQTADTFTGTGVRSGGFTDVTVRGALIRGYKAGVHVTGGSGHRIEGCDLSGNFRQRLSSTPDAEDLRDWLRPHDNDSNEWLERYGAALYLEDATKCHVSGNRGSGGQNGILLDRVTDTVVVGNDFSFNSGWGLALWRSSRNRVLANRFDWCVRGYSHGVYHRGQDSAGILLFEQCSENVIAGNSATHSGDGLFLYAGDETVRRTGRGGCNRNVVVGNDFSYAVANGIEATFSVGNVLVDNDLDGCDYGVWAGYSERTVIRGNRIHGSLTAGVAIEHGRENVITQNTIWRGPTGVWLWWDEDPDLADSAFGRRFGGNVPSSGNLVLGNDFLDVDREVVREGQNPPADRVASMLKGHHLDGALPKEMPDPPPVRTRLQGRQWMIVDEWGPFDFAEPRLVRYPGGQGEALFQLLLPPDAWPIRVWCDGAGWDVQDDVAGKRIRLSSGNPGWHDVVLWAEVGRSGDSVTLRSDVGLLVTEWDVSWRRWKTDPREDEAAWKRLLETKPIEGRSLPSVGFAWGGGGPSEEVGTDRFATLAETSVTLPEGEWEVVVVSDDGVRVFIDGSLAVERWDRHGPTEDRARVRLEAGPHAIRIEHFELDGWAALSFRLERVPSKREAE